MSHGITRKDVVLAVGTTAWHGLAIDLPEAFTLDRVEAEPAFNFEVALAESAYRHPTTGEWLAADGDRYTVRVDSDGSALPLGRVSAGFTVFSQRAALEIAREIERRLGGELRFDTAGTLFAGRRCWLQAQIEGQSFEVRSKLGAKFPHVARFTFAWGHDGRTPVVFKGNQVCVVCWNTSEVALNERAGGELRIAHTASVEEKVRGAVRVLTDLPGSLAENAEQLQRLAEVPMTLDDFEEFAAALILGFDTADPAERRELIRVELERKRPLVEGGEAKTSRALTHFERRLDEYRHEFLRRADAEGAGRTLFAAESAVTALVDHPTSIQGWLAEKRASYRRSVEAVRKLSRAADEAMFGSGAAIKRRARAELLRRAI